MGNEDRSWLVLPQNILTTLAAVPKMGLKYSHEASENYRQNENECRRAQKMSTTQIPRIIGPFVCSFVRNLNSFSTGFPSLEGSPLSRAINGGISPPSSYRDCNKIRGLLRLRFFYPIPRAITGTRYVFSAAQPLVDMSAGLITFFACHAACLLGIQGIADHRSRLVYHGRAAREGRREGRGNGEPYNWRLPLPQTPQLRIGGRGPGRGRMRELSCC